MPRITALLGRRQREPVPLDELGGRADGALAIVSDGGDRLHMSPHRVTSAVRFFLTRAQMHGSGLPHRLAITAALRGEGVSYVTRTLAAVIAYDTDASVVAVDLNWRGTKAADDSTDIQPTLVDAVERGTSVDEILHKTSNPRLFLVDPGEVALARRPAIARSRALEAVVDEISERFDHVLLDLPPVLASSDAISLAQLADAYALVVRQGATTVTQVETAIEELRGTNGLGVILNRADSSVPRRLRRMLGS